MRADGHQSLHTANDDDAPFDEQFAQLAGYRSAEQCSKSHLISVPTRGLRSIVVSAMFIDSYRPDRRVRCEIGDRMAR